MSQDGPFSLAEATAEFRRQQERLQAVSSRLKEVTTKVMSKDGMITVTLDSQGGVSAIAFNTAKFRRMAPARSAESPPGPVSSTREISWNVPGTPQGSVLAPGVQREPSPLMLPPTGEMTAAGDADSHHRRPVTGQPAPTEPGTS